MTGMRRERRIQNSETLDATSVHPMEGKIRNLAAPLCEEDVIRLGEEVMLGEDNGWNS